MPARLREEITVAKRIPRVKTLSAFGALLLSFLSSNAGLNIRLIESAS
jgi:hypothetical protein